MKIFSTIDSISSSFDGILLDAFGVFWQGGQVGPFPGAQETMENLVKQGKVVGVLSNSTQPAEKEKSKLLAFGFRETEHYHFYLTSGEIAKNLFRKDQLSFATPRKKYWLYGKPHPRFSSPHNLFLDTPYLATENLEEADFIYVGIPHLEGEDQTSPNVFREDVFKLSCSGLTMVCANPDRFAHEGFPLRAVVRQGSIAALYEEAGGTVFYIGKPAKQAYSTALSFFSSFGVTDASRILMVGDTPETDIRGARQMNMPCALVTQTGIMSDRIQRDGLENVLQQLNVSDYPHFFIERFANHVF